MLNHKVVAQVHCTPPPTPKHAKPTTQSSLSALLIKGFSRERPNCFFYDETIRQNPSRIIADMLIKVNDNQTRSVSHSVSVKQRFCVGLYERLRFVKYMLYRSRFLLAITEISIHISDPLGTRLAEHGPSCKCFVK